MATGTNPTIDRLKRAGLVTAVYEPGVGLVVRAIKQPANTTLTEERAIA